MSKIKIIVISIIVTLVFGLVGFYVFLPAINIKSELFWIAAIMVVGLVSILLTLLYSIYAFEVTKVNKLAGIVIMIFIEIGRASCRERV